MAKLVSHGFRLVANDGHVHHFVSVVYVSSEGEFSCQLPHELEISFNDAVASSGDDAQTHYTAVVKGELRAHGETKASLLAMVEAAMSLYHNAESSTDLVICYDYFSEVNYWQNPDGSIAANESLPEAVNETLAGKGSWSKHQLKTGSDIHLCKPASHFSVGLYAAVYKRITFHRTTGNTTRFEKLNSNTDIEMLSEPGRRLNAFVGISPIKPISSMKQLPYSDGTASFFFEALLSMCEIGRTFQAFFDSHDHLLMAAGGFGPRLIESLKFIEDQPSNSRSQARASECISRGAWSEIDLPSPAELTADLLTGKAVEIEGHRLQYVESEAQVWIANLDGLDGVLGAEPTEELSKQFLTRIAMGDYYTSTGMS
ncbi:MAG: hypothetical protein V7693_15805 [Halopseudomonas sabulinigri]